MCQKSLGVYVNPSLRFFKKLPEYIAAYNIASCRAGALFGDAVGVPFGSFDASKTYIDAKQSNLEPFPAASNAAIVTFSRCTMAGMVAGPIAGFSPLWVAGLWGEKRILRNNSIDEREPRPKI